ncbi:hypothetical protein CYPRO_2798 [Cyclonatronum proteinivorum]|uniref:YtxH-like protein n=1 Tax=Cyclonatronum proteinivorum TaxID=1457365 RepID=A0A345UNI4_9BACT|nr:YtxH domain-containing protein [Cyclonatronum proteinivorum]AXJ02036.1 hypothetical protein CYPRO_2798 [Cyclonatronum proteinivorum]
MAKFSTPQLLITAVSAFAGGVLFAWLSSPRSGPDNRRWISDSTSDLKNKVKESGKGLKTKNFPDLYEATEDLGLTEEDLLPGNR